MEIRCFSTDAAPLDASRRIMSFAVASAAGQRLAVLQVSGGMMDIGWAERVAVPVRTLAQAFVDDASRPFPDAVTHFVRGARMALTELEFNDRLYSNVKFALLERCATECHVARIGGLQVLARRRSGDVTRIGSEDVVSLTPGGPPLLATACLIPNLRWKASKDAPHGTIEDESEKAARFAEQVRHDTWDVSNADTVVVLTHPFWTGVEIAGLSAATDDTAFQDALRTIVVEARPARSDTLAVLWAEGA